MHDEMPLATRWTPMGIKMLLLNIYNNSLMAARYKLLRLLLLGCRGMAGAAAAACPRKPA